jgi:hypothetical protein
LRITAACLFEMIGRQARIAPFQRIETEQVAR